MSHTVLMTSHRNPVYADLIFDNIPHGIFTVGSTGRITSFNQTAEQVTGWKADEVLGRPCREVFRSSHCDESCFLLESMEGRGPHTDQEVTIERKDGSDALVSVSTAALRDDDGRVIGGVEMFRDLAMRVTLRKELQASYTCGDIISKSGAMKGVRELLPLVAKSDSTVLVEGEPGTGKELVARAIHNLGPRRDGPFVAVNCGALPDTLVEAELFGHAKGAFTDAKHERQGRFAMAQGGTLLLDEIGDVSAAVQVKLLRVLQEREYVPLGANDPVKANVRILAATNRDLSHEALNGRFRQDLFFRLNVVRVVLPPLRSRWEDIPLLVDHFIKRFNAIQGRRIIGISQTAMAALMEHSFPGNVRELENAIEHAFVVCSGTTFQLEDLPPHIRGKAVGQVAQRREPEAPPLEAAEASAIRSALERNSGNRTRAAKELGISRNTLWRKMKKHRIR
ncbi:MAG: PAS domain S-box protein [bacterium]|nr:PAS domain S-box protein [bacterium]